MFFGRERTGFNLVDDFGEFLGAFVILVGLFGQFTLFQLQLRHDALSLSLHLGSFALKIPNPPFNLHHSQAQHIPQNYEVFYRFFLLPDDDYDENHDDDNNNNSTLQCSRCLGYLRPHNLRG